MGGAEKEMEIVIDTNKILSAILTSGKVRKIIVFSPLKFIAPKYLLVEVAKYKHKLCERFKISLETFDYIANELIYPRIEMRNFMRIVYLKLLKFPKISTNGGSLKGWITEEKP